MTPAGVDPGSQSGDVDSPPPLVVTVRFKPCGCGVLDGEICDCAEFAAEAAHLFKAPIFLDLRGPQMHQAGQVPA